MLRAIILCCDEQNKNLGMKEYSVTPTTPARDNCHYDGGLGGGVDRSYGDGLNCGYMQERFSYSSGQSPSYTNYRMGWSTGYMDCQGNARHHEGIISTPLPNKYRSRSASGQVSGGMLLSREEVLEVCSEDFPDMEENISDDSLSKWPPSGLQKDSLRKGFYTSFNRDIFQDRSDLECPDLWSSLEYPPSPKDAFRETCEFYGDPAVSSKRSRASRKYQEMNGRIDKFSKEKPKRLELYKSDSKLSHLYAESSCEETETLSNPIGRSKSLHDLQPSFIQQGQGETQVGLSEQDLNRARSVLGLPITESHQADSQPGSARNSINLSLVSGEVRRTQQHRYRSQSYNRRENSQLQRSVTPSAARVSFPSPCITGQSSPPSSAPSPQSLTLLKQYYLDCILKIDPNHPVGQTFQKDVAASTSNTRHKKGRAVKNPEYKRMWSHSRAENMRLRGEINDLRSDLERANRNLDLAFQDSSKNPELDSDTSEKKVMESKLAEIREQIRALSISGNLTSQQLEWLVQQIADLKKETRRLSKVVLKMTCSSQKLQRFKGASKF